MRVKARFEQNEIVTLHWNGNEYRTRIVRRLYDPDKNEWLYELAGGKQFYSADVLEPYREKAS